MIDVESIAKSEKYINYCKKVTCYNNVLWKDLHQEFCIAVILQKDRVCEINESEIDLYFYGIIYQIFNNHKRGRNTFKLEKDVFYSITDNKQNLDDYCESIKANTLTYNEKEVRKSTIQELNNLLESNNKKTREGAIYLRLYIEGKNRLQISKELGINYRIVHESIENTISIIKAKLTGKSYMTKTTIQITLRGEGVKASYSGKDKTFYVDKLPASGIIKEVESAGFKIAKSK